MWLYVPGISDTSPSAPAEAGSISASSWQCLTLARSCWWRGKPSPSPLWSKRCKSLFWLRRLYGRMPHRSTAVPGVASWVASLAASHASPIPSRGAGAASTIPETSGRTPGGSSLRRAPGGSSSRTCPACSPPHQDSAPVPTVFAETYDAWVMRLRADYSRRPRLAPATSESASSSSQWPTATTDSATDRQGRYAQGGMPLSAAAATWPTPTVRDERNPNAKPLAERGGGKKGEQLPNFIAHQWSTPRAIEGEKGGKWQKSGTAPATETLTGQALSPLRPETETHGDASSPTTRALNPLFVEWLMGWPPGWTEIAISGPGSSACGSLETGLYRWKQRMRSELSRIGSPSAASARQLNLFGE